MKWLSNHYNLITIISNYDNLNIVAILSHRPTTRIYCASFPVQVITQAQKLGETKITKLELGYLNKVKTITNLDKK